ncbi:hypothetical protein CYLTODRAFT_424555 [Cylindrobasidium torrendii FP15055 ss-10]|uniref:Arrestin-like N-terminal domain-containing protein n=1 Tax=Cylindrobasidium torrendii FP15055 ss-10 TaxID=1314674 RepID=A0A0D7B4X2_9AGAR|nr:hypothetical protein CYLTODRAFT_424555 [Cylindrobasidium torrendii FP15055 ss-10]
MDPELDVPLDIQLPAYELDVVERSPTYSERPGLSEIRLHPEPLSPNPSCSTQHWRCETKHMKIDLGPHIWGLSSPSYGQNGTVVGSIRLTGQRLNIEQLSVTFEGRLTTFRPYYGPNSDTAATVVSHTVQLYSACTGVAFPWDKEHHFSMPIPSEVNTPGGSTVPTPPSYNCYFYGSALGLAYSIKIDLVHKSNGIRKHESKVIPVYYLPKSRPTEPQLSTIPRPARLQDDSPLYLSWLDKVHTTPVIPSWPSRCKQSLEPFEKSIFLSLPDPLVACSGDNLPFGISLIYPSDPALAKILTRCIRVTLVKRILFGPRRRLLGKSDDTESAHSEWVLDTGELKSQNEFAEGVRLLRGFVKVGGRGREASWHVDCTGVQYLLKLSIVPPKHMACYIPVFSAEVPVEVTTDHWDPLAYREESSLDGIPTPAIGLASDPSANWIGTSAYGSVV